MAEKWSRFGPERILLGAHRFLGAAWICTKFNTIYPFVKPSKVNAFAQGVLGLNDRLTYQDSLIPSHEVWEIFPEIQDVEVTLGKVYPPEGSSISTYEMLVLGSIVRHEGAKRVFEIGTSFGQTSYNLARNLPEEGILYTLDLPPAVDGREIETRFKVTNSDSKMIFANRNARRFCGTGMELRIQQLYGDSATFDYGPYEKSIDIVFVDGAHSYEYVKSDTAAAMRLVKPGGLVIWHDYNDGHFWPDVSKYLHQFGREQPVQRVSGTDLAISRVGVAARQETPLCTRSRSAVA